VTRRLRKKFAQICEKVAKLFAKPINAQISSLKLNLKVRNINIKPLLNSKNECKKQYFAPKICLGLIKSSRNGEILPNLVTLIVTLMQKIMLSVVMHTDALKTIMLNVDTLNVVPSIVAAPCQNTS
jgi:hypothetical protein